MQSREVESEINADRRRQRRRRVMWIGTVAKGGISQPCVILDLSSGGAKVHLPFPLPLQRESITLSCAHIGSVITDTVWQNCNFAGLKFK